MEIRQGDFFNLLVMATRYAIPRNTYAGSEVRDFFKDYISCLSINDIEFFIKDIKKHVDESNSIDKPYWINLIKMLEDKVNE
jgi:hypothetical protein